MPRTSTRTEAAGSGEEDLVVQLRLAILRLARRMRQAAPAGITSSQLSALSSLDRKGPLALRALAECERVQPPTMTRIVAALEDEGLATRSPDPDDGRSVLVDASAKGRQLLARNRADKDSWLHARVDPLPVADREALARAAELMARFVEEGR